MLEFFAGVVVGGCLGVFVVVLVGHPVQHAAEADVRIGDHGHEDDPGVAEHAAQAGGLVGSAVWAKAEAPSGWSMPFVVGARSPRPFQIVLGF